MMDQKDRFANLALRHRASLAAAKPKLPPPPVMEEQGRRCLAGEVPEHSDGFDVTALLEEMVRRELAGPWTREVGVYHPSSVNPSACRRALYYDRIGVMPRPCHGMDTQSIFDEGHGTHHIIQQRLLRHAGFEEEVKIRIDSLHVAGSTDGVFRNEDWVLEIKSVGESSFLSINKPNGAHVWQMHLYMYALDIPRAQLLYVNRNNGSKRMFRVPFSVETWGQIEALLREVEGHVERQEPPDRIDVPYVCRQCKFQQDCRPREQKESTWISSSS